MKFLKFRHMCALPDPSSGIFTTNWVYRLPINLSWLLGSTLPDAKRTFTWGMTCRDIKNSYLYKHRLEFPKVPNLGLGL
jgi:hypothetical protein